jgi:hypothetical protein
MAFFDKDFILKVVDATDLLALVRGYVTLEKKGDRWVGCCPFHKEKTGSFGVREKKNIFKCFGCGAGGDAIKFLQRIENISFPEAVRRLCAKHGLSMPDGQAAGEWKQKQRRRSPEEIAAQVRQRKQAALARRAERSMDALLDKYSWSSAQMAGMSDYLPDTPLEEARALLRLFQPDDIVWTGRWQHSISADEAGNVRAERPEWFEEVQSRFRTAQEWLADGRTTPGPRICPSAMREGCVSRSDASAKVRRFLVIEHDKIDLPKQAALLRWLHESATLKLRAVVFTGGKSLHGWFDAPAAAAFDDLKTMLCGVPPTDPKDKRQRIYGMGFDVQCFIPSQPFRIPGWPNEKTGKRVRLLFLNK